MLHSSEIWECIRTNLPKDKWTRIDKIYEFVQSAINLDQEDFQPQSPSSPIPKWKRNVRNVLQHRKQTGDIEWDENSNYMIRS